MRLVSTAELKNRTNEVLRTALAGDPVVVTRHGRPVASLLRLEEADLATLAGGARRSSHAAAVGQGAGRGRPRAGRAVVSLPLGPYQYAAFPQAFGTFFVAYGPGGPAFARIAPTAVAFERDALRYLGAPVRRAAPPAWLVAAVVAAVRRGDAFRGAVDLRRLGPFEGEVLARLRRIPAGAVRTYQEIARAVGQPGAARAVGAACARNPLPLLIPCHRVVRTDGGLGGYSLRGGVALKRRLLEAEGALPTLPL
ncbi:MAG: type II toxin-antitoxin system prevent-host-death family antitoxin [bacterium]